ncbi:MAG: 8-oxoguanine deaminase, partial [Caldilineaceae bacterium]|nr:8-oxoguanine deaminase [Caldilineaceae bacterium]
PGMAADIVAFRLDTLWHAGGAVHDPLAALVFCQPQPVAWAIVNGVPRVRDGRLVGLDLVELVERHNRAAVGLASRAGMRG